MRPIAYVGITGFKEDREVRTVAEQFLEHGFLGPEAGHTAKYHVPMFGFLCSSKRLADRRSQGEQSPRAEVLDCLARYTPHGAIPMIHYFTENRKALAEEVKRVFSIGDMYEKDYCRAVQINMEWPDTDQIEAIRKEFPEMDVVLQLPKEALKDSQRAIEYGDLVQYCLIDPSGGKGQEISDEHLGLVKILHDSMPNTRIGVAGGLNGDNVREIMKKVYDAIGDFFCIDAQGQLRTDDKTGLHYVKTAKYIDSASYGVRIGEKFYG
ncbi:hypothetical protein HYV87_04160 [Candidatus Woesearchaeota archaeon]|nr:hypothetical protein [Candidatus Woesearchaeota archaeon]